MVSVSMKGVVVPIAVGVEGPGMISTAELATRWLRQPAVARHYLGRREELLAI